MLGLALAAVIGVVLLFSAQAEPQMGASALLALLVAALALGLTLLNLLELLGGSSGKGGSYGLVFETLGGTASFLTGWSMLAAQAALVAALLLFAGRTIGAALRIAAAPELLGLALLLPLLLIQVFQYGRGRGLARAALALAAAALLTLLAATLPSWSAAAARPEQALAAGRVWSSAGRMIVLYMAVEAVLASRRQIRARAVTWTQGVLGGAAVAIGLATLSLAVIGGVMSAQSGPLVEHLSRTSGVPLPLAAAVLTWAALLSAGSLLLLGARQLNDLALRGALPQILRTPRRPFVLPPLLFVAFGLLTSFLLFASRWLPLVDLAGWLLLISLGFLCVAAISSRRNEPDRRREFELPFFPLVPALTLGFLLSLLINVASSAQLSGGIWLGLGLALFLLYGRKRQAAAQEGVTLFGSDKRIEKPEGTYRILVPLAPGEQRQRLLDVATALARRLGGDVMPLQVITVADPIAMEQGRRLAQDRNQHFRWLTQQAAEAGVPVYPVTRLARTVAEGILDTVVEEQCDLLLMPWSVSEAEDQERMGTVIEPVISQSTCDTVVFAFKESEAPLASEAEGGSGGPNFQRILVPTAGGPHAPLAIGLAWALAEDAGGRVVATYVAPDDASEAEISAGEDRIWQTIEAIRESAADALKHEQTATFLDRGDVKAEVVQAGSVADGILSACERADLLLIGASEESLIDQVLFGNLPRQIAAEAPVPVMMVRRHRGLPRFWLRRIWESLSSALPTVAREEQIEIYKLVRRGARPDADFFVMMGVATLIGTIGLMQNSAAVIIGSMLVAPLFTPILAVSLGLAQGDIRMLRVALEAMVKGIFLGIAVATVTAWGSPLNLVTDEILLRTQPNLFDLGVALAAGVAGAYAIAREEVAAALPGVAIAAALVPPLGVVGFGLAIGDLSMAGGAGLLVLTNLIAIAMAGSVTLLLLGFRPGRRAERGDQLRRGLLVALLLLVVIAVPLAAFFGRAVSETRIEQAIQEVVSQYFAAEPQIQFVGFQFESGGDQVAVEVTVWAEQEIPANVADELAQALNGVLGRGVDLRIQAVQVQEVESRTQ